MTPLMTTAAERRPCTAYLMGCPTIAEKVCRRDPAVMLCAPLRALIYIDPGGRTRFAAGQPGTVFAGFADQAIAELGAGLGHQFAELLKASASEGPRFSAPRDWPATAVLTPIRAGAGRVFLDGG